MQPTHAQQFRELIRLLERNLEKLNANDICSCSISLAQCHTLVEIGRLESVSLKDLAHLLRVDNSTMSRTVESLVQNNLVIRSSSPKDRRSVDIKLSETGRNYFLSIENNMNEKFKTIFNNIPVDEQSNVLSSLKLIINAFSIDTSN